MPQLACKTGELGIPVNLIFPSTNSNPFTRNEISSAGCGGPGHLFSGMDNRVFCLSV